MPMVEVSRKIVRRTSVRGGGVDERPEGVRGAPLLHQDRGQPRVERTGRQDRADHLRPDAGVEVVDVGLQDQQVVDAVGRRHRRVADEQPQHVRVALGVAAAGTDPDLAGGHRRLRSPAGRDRGEQRGAGRGAELHRGRTLRTGVRRRRRGAARRPRAAGPAACRARRGPMPEPTATGLTTTWSAPSATTPAADADDVGDRVEGADLVEVHVHRLAAVDRGLGDREPLEDAEREVAHRLGEIRLEQHAPGCRARCGGAASRRRRRGSGWPRSPPASRVSRRSVTGSGLTASTARWTTSTGTPAPSSAPSSMSPLAPEDASTQTTLLMRVLPSPGPPARRRRPRRTRCRCSPP